MRQELDLVKIADYSTTTIREIDFTKWSRKQFVQVINLADFAEKDAAAIFQALKNEIRLIPFGDYLKRYIYLKAGMTGDYAAIDIKEYQHIIIDSFKENCTPKSFTETTAKLSALAKNWLTQVSVNRSVIFLLGFGLNMSVNDVSAFLINAQRERDFNFKDPDEIMYWFCLKNGYKFPKLQLLRQQYNALDSGNGALYSNKTIGMRNRMQQIADEEALMSYLAEFKTELQKPAHSLTAWQWFCKLYQQCKEIIACYYNLDEQEKLESEIAGYRTAVKNSQRLSASDKREHIAKMKSECKVWTADDITEADAEKVLCCGIPTNKDGNLKKLSLSKLARHFSNKRFSRQHIYEVLDRSVAVNRFDLITLNFFIFSQAHQYAEDNKARYTAFVKASNAILAECLMGELYIANPYECFLLMCMVADCPLATYAEVWELSFKE